MKRKVPKEKERALRSYRLLPRTIRLIEEYCDKHGLILGRFVEAAVLEKIGVKK